MRFEVLGRLSSREGLRIVLTLNALISMPSLTTKELTKKKKNHLHCSVLLVYHSHKSHG